MDDTMRSPVKLPLPLVLATFVILLAGMKAASAILVPFFLAVFIATICTPPLFWMQSKGVPKILALILILLAILLVGFFFGVMISSSVNQFLASLPAYQEQLSATVASTVEQLSKWNIHVPAEEFSGVLHPGWVMSLAGEILSTLSGVLTDAFLIFVTAVFILLEVTDFPKKLRIILPHPERSLATIETFSQNAQSYLILKTLISAATALAVWLWLLLLGIDYPTLWGILAFLLNYVPNLGSIIAALPPLLLALVTFGLWPAFLTLLGLTLINIIFGYILEPTLMGSRLRLSTLVAFLSLCLWGWVLGPLGMILSVPITSLALIAMESYAQTRKFAIMLGTRNESEWLARLKLPIRG